MVTVLTFIVFVGLLCDYETSGLLVVVAFLAFLASLY